MELGRRWGVVRAASGRHTGCYHGVYQFSLKAIVQRITQKTALKIHAAPHAKNSPELLYRFCRMIGSNRVNLGCASVSELGSRCETQRPARKLPE
jgi:hypothetical protein